MDIKKAASHPDVPRPSNDELVALALQLCHAIEKCGASEDLTHASMLASDLHTYLQKPSDIQSMLDGLNQLTKACHGASKAAGWWSDLHTGEPLPLTQERVGDKMMLIVTEIAEAKEGVRKNMMDDHLPGRPMVEVELADAVIRIADLAGALDLDLAGAVIDKMAYNAHRPDHKLENRKAANGKKS